MMEPVAWRLDKALDGYETPMNGSREVILRFSSDEEFSFFIDAISTGKVGVRLSDAEARIAELEAVRVEELEIKRTLQDYVAQVNSKMATWVARCAEAEARTEAAEALLKEAGKALEPFAKAADIKLCGEWRDDERFAQTDVGHYLYFGHLRAARAIHDKIGVKDE